MILVSKEAVIAGFKDLAEHKIRNIITLIGIVLGTMSIAVVVSISDGIRQSSLEFINQTSNIKNVEIRRNWEFRKDGIKRYLEFEEFEQLKNNLPEVEYFNPKLQEWGRFSYKDKSYYCRNYGVLPDFKNVENWDVQTGRFIDNTDLKNNSNVVVIGTKLEEELFGNESAIGKVVTFYRNRFVVIGVMEHKFYSSPGGNLFQENQLAWMNRRAFIPFTTMYNKIDKRQNISRLLMQVYDVKDIPKVVKKTENYLLNIRKREPVFKVETTLEELETNKKNFMFVQLISILISAISILVGGIVIMNIMLASIKERTKEIGVRMAVGAKGIHIFIQFLIQTIIMVTIGGIGGIIAAINLIDVVENFLQLPLSVTPSMIIISLGITGIIGLLAGLLPSYKASKLDPIKALRYE